VQRERRGSAALVFLEKRNVKIPRFIKKEYKSQKTNLVAKERKY
jgi:hypothetical protein